MKRHFLIRYEEEIGYITACNLKYEDADNINFTDKWEETNCKKCLVHFNKLKSKLQEKEKK